MVTQVRASPLAPALAPLDGVVFPLRPFTVDEYDRLVEIGVIAPGEAVELVEGYVEMKPGCGSLDNAILAFRGGRTVFLRRFTVEECPRMIAAGVLEEGEQVELLEGMIVQVPTQNPPHGVALYQSQQVLPPLMPAGWIVRVQLPIVVGASERAPDIAVVRGPIRRYLQRHPTRSDIAILGEITDSTIKKDRQVLPAIYARDRIPVYWIINLADSQIEVYTHPSIDDSGAAYYKARQDYGPKELLPVVIKSRVVRTVRVRDLLP